MLVRTPIPKPAAPRSFAVPEPGDPFWKTVHRIADGLVPEMRNRFIEAVRQFADVVDVDVLQRYLESGNRAGALESLPWSLLDSYLTTLKDPMERALGETGDAAAARMSRDFGVELKFDLMNPAALEWVQAHSAKMVREVGDETKLAVRRVIDLTFMTGTGPYDAARQIRQLVGLTKVQAQAVANYRHFLEGLALRESLADLPEGIIARLQRGGLRRNQLAKLARTGMTPERIEQLVEAYRNRLIGERAETIARTELIAASSAGQRLLWEQAVEQGLIDAREWERCWLLTPDDRLCDRCLAMKDQRAPIGGKYRGGISGPPLHPKCLPGDTRVSATGIAAVSQRWYEGDLVVIRTAGGKHLACTPNHPILATSGWVAARVLKKGDHVVCRLGHKGTPGGDSDDQEVPARIEDMAHTIRGADQVSAVPVPLSPEDFHGDGKGSQVAVIWADGLLVGGLDPSLFEHGRECEFGGGDMESSLLDGLRVGDLCLKCHRNPLCRPVGSGNLTCPLLGAHAGPFEGLRLALTPRANAESQQAASDAVAVDPVVVGQSLLGESAEIESPELRKVDPLAWVADGATVDPLLLEDPVYDDLRGTEFPGEIGCPASGQILLDNVISVDVLPFRGHVYNLQTASGWYVAEGIVTHNCRCAEGLTRRGPKGSASRWGREAYPTAELRSLPSRRFSGVALGGLSPRQAHLPGKHDQDSHAGKNRRPIDVKSPRPQTLGTSPDLGHLYPPGTPGREHVRAAKVVINKRGKGHITGEHPEREEWARENSDMIRRAFKNPEWVSSAPRFDSRSGHWRLELAVYAPGMTGTKRDHINLVLSLANLPGEKESKFHQVVTAHPAPRRYFYEKTPAGDVLKPRWRRAK